MNSGRSDAGMIDVLDRVLDKGIVIDAHVRVALVGLELLAVEARVVVASIETYLVHAETVAYTGMAGRPAPAPRALPFGATPPGGLPIAAVPPLIAETIDPEPTPPLAIEESAGNHAEDAATGEAEEVE